MFDSFRKKSKFQRRGENPVEAQISSGIDFGVIVKLYSGTVKYRADIRLFTGTILSKVRLPGPYMGSQGYFSGFKTGYFVNQFAVIGYRNNRLDSPICIAVMPFPVSEIDNRNLSQNSTFDAGEVSAGHKSGHRTIWDDMKILFKKQNITQITIDYTNKKIILADGWQIIVSDGNNEVTIGNGDVIAGSDVPATQTTLKSHIHTDDLGNTSPPVPGT